MSDEVDIDPPVMQDDELIVRCEQSGCNKTARVGTDIDAVESSDNGDGWRISFVPAADGRLEVDGVECPDHRVADAINELAEMQVEFSKELDKTGQVVEKLDPES